jgi:hypothetical protein
MPDPVKKKINDNPLAETKWTTKGRPYVTTGEANVWFQLNEFVPSSKVPKIHFKQEVKIDCKPHGFWSRLHFHQVYFQTQQSTFKKEDEEFLKK